MLDNIKDLLGKDKEVSSVVKALADELSDVLGREVKVKQGGVILHPSDMNKEEID